VAVFGRDHVKPKTTKDDLFNMSGQRALGHQADQLGKPAVIIVRATTLPFTASTIARETGIYFEQKVSE
jgi:hypothetical protein